MPNIHHASMISKHSVIAGILSSTNKKRTDPLKCTIQVIVISSLTGIKKKIMDAATYVIHNWEFEQSYLY